MCRAPEALEGLSLVPHLHGKDVPWREAVFSELDYAFHADVRKDLGRTVDECRGYMVFDGRWKFIFWEGFPPMLFDHENDPNEQIDLGGASAYQAVVERMEKLLFAWLRGLKNRTTVDKKFVEDWRDSELAIGQW